MTDWPTWEYVELMYRNLKLKDFEKDRLIMLHSLLQNAYNLGYHKAQEEGKK